ncbi:hypothetical protein BC938DRAFT_483907, partial [Jimgerdemannia flammicorona]
MCDGETEGVALVPAETTLMGIYQRCLAASWMRTQMMESEYWVMVSVRFDVGTIRGAPISVEHQRQNIISAEGRGVPAAALALAAVFVDPRIHTVRSSRRAGGVAVQRDRGRGRRRRGVLWSVLVDKTTVLVGVIEVEVMADDDAEETAEIEVEGEVEVEVECEVDFEVEGEVEGEVEVEVALEVEVEVVVEVEVEVAVAVRETVANVTFANV